MLHMSLIKINEDTEMISLHRLVQEAYYYHQPEDKRHETFRVAYRVLCEAFPKRELRRQMYQVWGTCELLIHHIEAAQDKYELLRPTGLDVQDPALHIMLADATWYELHPPSRQCLRTWRLTPATIVLKVLWRDLLLGPG